MLPNRELWFTAPYQVEIRAGRAPQLTPGCALVRALASGVSQGTELLLYRGEGPNPFDPSLGDRASPPFPRRYGYSWVGQVQDVAPDVTSLSVGERVFALAPHGDVHVLPLDSMRPLDEGTPAARATLAANLETALNCIWDSRVSLGDRVVILGAGIVGLLIGWLCVKMGATVRAVDPSKQRRAAAAQLGLTAENSPQFESAGHGADIVIEASGNPKALDVAVEYAGLEALIVIVSNYGLRTHPLTLGQSFHRRRLRIQSSQVSSLPPDRVARWTPERRFECVKQLLRDSQLDVLLDNVVAFGQAPEVYRQLNEQPGQFRQTIFTYA